MSSAWIKTRKRVPKTGGRYLTAQASGEGWLVRALALDIEDGEYIWWEMCGPCNTVPPPTLWTEIPELPDWEDSWWEDEIE